MSETPSADKTPATVPARLALEDGTVFPGTAFGDTSPKAVDAEVCFNTSMAGYQEILTDPSYAGQIVTMTYPLIGNYGVNDDDLESARPQVEGFVVRELANRQSNYRSTAKLEAWLASHGVTGISGIDTRALTRRLRTRGALNGVLCTDPAISDEQLVEQAKAAQGVNANLAAKVSRTEPLAWDRGLGDWAPLHGSIERDPKRYKVVALDCGAKLNILRNLVDQGCDVTVLPWDASAETILQHKPDGLFVSNGPGDPAAVEATVATLKQLLGKLPIFGICLGHQLLCLALGAKTYKLPFGHRGANHPIQNLKLNILRNLVDQGCDVTVLPWDSPAETILQHKPDGLFVSNGPGDPAAVEATVATLKQLLGKLPIFGICLGHQLLCLALGAKTYKLPFGHRGANHPIQNLGTGKVEITSQNHGFAVETDSVVAAGAEPTHINLNDNTLAGFRHAGMPVFAIQYHPEASPGPHDARYLFDCFIDMMATGKSPSAEAMDRAQRQRNRVTAAAV